jgi:hypothetical protein
MFQDEAIRSTKLDVQLFETHDDIGKLEKFSCGGVQKSLPGPAPVGSPPCSPTSIERLSAICLVMNSALLFRRRFSLSTFVE